MGIVGNIIHESIDRIMIRSLLKSNRQRGEQDLKKKLTAIVPDISEQYTAFRLDGDGRYLMEKVRGQHAFQTGLALRAIERFREEKKADRVNVVDIGDSAGTHLRYLEGLKEGLRIDIASMSVNLDPEAVKKIKKHGIHAVQCRAEDLHRREDGIAADIFLSFEMLEHLFDPISFLHSLAERSKCAFFVITVPLVYRSRIGLHHIRRNLPHNFDAENTHILELCPEDWDLLFRFSGWEVVFRDLYTQYPCAGIFQLTKYLWRRRDYEGFYGLILTRNREWSRRYRSW